MLVLSWSSLTSQAVGALALLIEGVFSRYVYRRLPWLALSQCSLAGMGGGVEGQVVPFN